jgi:ATP-dependent DNA helicase DinG
VFNARRQAMAADVVVINHHLFFADVALRDSGVAELLPSVEAVVFDEAHQLSDTGLQFLGVTLGSGQIADLAKDILRLGLSKARGWRDWGQLAQNLEDSGRRLRWAGHPSAAGTTVNLKRRWQEGLSNPEFLPAIEAVSSAAATACLALEDVAASDPELAQLQLRSQQLQSLAERFTGVAADDRIRWIDVTAHSLRLVESPLDVRQIMSSQRQASGKSWIFTSATLGEDDRLDWFCASTGLEDAVKLKIASPFDFANHARLWIVNDLPKPSDPNHASRVGAVAARCAQKLGGRTFVLTTTLRAIAKVAQVIEDMAAAGGTALEVLTQGSQPKRVLLSQFGDGAGKVLVGSHSFWEGIDVPGDALQCVVIDKLPFPPPSDPLIEARSQRIEQGGGDAFNELFVPEATIALKQGAGRLIRSETDRGLLVICDSRMARMGYGRRMRAALPAMTVVADAQEAQAWLDSLTN